MKASRLIELYPHSEGIVIGVRATPGARRNGVQGVQGGLLRVSVTQVAERGKANRALRDLLAQQLDLRKSQLEIISGQTSIKKRVLIRGLDRATLVQRIRDLQDRS